jgi:predicted nucleotidyltransferase component of viral defense system
MLDKAQHQLVMARILKEIYENNNLAAGLGFKGGTCAYIFYNLPRFSVDLDFDLLSEDIPKELVLKSLLEVVEKHGHVKEQIIKRSTILLVVSYGVGEHKIKIEVNTRLANKEVERYYENKDYLGADILAAKKEYLFAGKLAALTKRTNVVPRDIYDIHFFLDEGWQIDYQALQLLVQEDPQRYIKSCLKAIEKFNNTHILQGLGELIDESEKERIRKKLKNDTIFLLRNHLEAIKRENT